MEASAELWPLSKGPDQWELNSSVLLWVWALRPVPVLSVSFLLTSETPFLGHLTQGWELCWEQGAMGLAVHAEQSSPTHCLNLAPSALITFENGIWAEQSCGRIWGSCKCYTWLHLSWIFALIVLLSRLPSHPQIDPRE